MKREIGGDLSVTAIGEIPGYVLLRSGQLDLIDPLVDLPEMIVDFRVQVHLSLKICC